MGILEKRAGGQVMAEGEGGRIIGYAAVYGPSSEDLGGFRERVHPDAFKRSLEDGRDIRALVDHDTAKVLGRRSADTLRLSTDETGLRVEIQLPATTYARDLAVLMERGDVSQMSFAFTLGPKGDRWDGRGDDGIRIRTLMDVDLVEVSVVTIPAYPDTSAALRSLSGHEAGERSRGLWLAQYRTAPWWGYR